MNWADILRSTMRQGKEALWRGFTEHTAQRESGGRHALCRGVAEHTGPGKGGGWDALGTGFLELCPVATIWR